MGDHICVLKWVGGALFKESIYAIYCAYKSLILLCSLVGPRQAFSSGLGYPLVWQGYLIFFPQSLLWKKAEVFWRGENWGQRTGWQLKMLNNFEQHTAFFLAGLGEMPRMSKNVLVEMPNESYRSLHCLLDDTRVAFAVYKTCNGGLDLDPCLFYVQPV